MKVGVGRSFSDVPPNRGLYKGPAAETIDVAVHSEELDGIPPELAAERFQSLQIPTFASSVSSQRESVHQQEQQQQERQDEMRIASYGLWLLSFVIGDLSFAITMDK